MVNHNCKRFSVFFCLCLAVIIFAGLGCFNDGGQLPMDPVPTTGDQHYKNSVELSNKSRQEYNAAEREGFRDQSHLQKMNEYGAESTRELHESKNLGAPE